MKILEKVCNAINADHHRTIDEISEINGSCVQKKQPEMWSSGDWFLHHNNALCPHGLQCAAVFGKKHDSIPQPPYSPDLAPCNFFLFPRMKHQMKRKRFADVSEVQKETEVLDNISTEEFQKCFQQWEKHWYKCIESKGESFVGDWSCNSIKPNKPF